MKTPSLNTLWWLVKRELWEHRGGFVLAPVIVGGIVLLINLLAMISAEVWARSAATTSSTSTARASSR